MRLAQITSFSLALILWLWGAAAWCADLSQQLDALLASEPGAERDALLAEVVAVAPPWSEVAAQLASMTFPVAEPGQAALRTTVCLDGVERPWVIYVPSSYDPACPTPLLVALHGGVSRPEIIDDPLAHVEESEYLALAEMGGMLALYPYGQEGATWWDEVGMANVRDLIRTAKREYNVDDDRVYMIGFSDGASAGFCHAMVAPSDYAAIVALNGHLGVGSLDGDLPTYAPNLANTPVYAVTTFDDQLYPSAAMRPAILLVQDAAGDIYYREFDGVHEFTYADEELPRIARFLERHPRDPFPSRIVWEVGDPKFGLCRWFSVDRIALAEAAPWHVDHNVALVDEMIVVGFIPADDEGVSGVGVATVLEDTMAEQIGLAEGDVIVRGGDHAIGDSADLWEWKTTVKRGDRVELEILRDGQSVILRGQLPEPEAYFVFKRDRPSALAEVSYAANRIDVAGSRLGAFSILVHPDMVDLDRNLVVTLNGEVAFDARVEPDIGFMLSNFLDNRDRRLLYVAKIEIEIKADA
jgi:predicted esterase